MSDGTPSSSKPVEAVAPAAPRGARPSAAELAIIVAGSALLVDAAVETWRSGPPVRWWAAGAAALYLLVSGLTWRRRIGWQARLAIAGVAVLGLFAATAWLPGGLTEGVRLAGQPTGIVLAASSLLALLLAVLLWARATVVATRLAAGVLVIYALAPFALAVWHRTPVSVFWSPTASRASGDSAVPGPIAQASTAPASQPDADAQTMAAVRGVIQRIADAPEPPTFDVAKTADSIGNDPPALFAYVRSHVRTEIYAGVLRGARGTLLGGAGNAWDQALLLAAMLRHHGREVRFAHAHLTPDVAATIVDRMFGDAGRPGAGGGATVQVPDSLESASRATLAQIRNDAQGAEADLLTALTRANVPLGDAAPSEQTLQSEAADHLFVEYRDGDRWVALDPVAASSAGAMVAPDTETLPDVPDAFYHHVTIRVSIEERRARRLVPREVARFATTSAALDGQQVLLAHRFSQDIAGRWRATPVLQVGGTPYAARAFAETGLVAGKAGSKEDLIGQAHKTVGQLGQVTGVFDNGSTPAPAAASDAELSAESLEVEFTDPAKRSDVVRREMLDRIGPVARGNNQADSAPLAPFTVANGIPLELSGVYALAFAPGPVNPALPLRRLSASRALVDDVGVLKRALAVQNASLGREDQERLGRVLGAYPALLQAWAETTLAVSQRLARNLPGRDGSLRFYEATPRLVIASFDPVTGALALDLRRDVLRAVVRNAPPVAVVRANLSRSVMDAAIEADVLALKARTARLAGIDIFSRARREGIHLVAFRGGASLPALQAPDQARARMANIEPGNVLVAPERAPTAIPPRFAWWKLNPTTGDATSVLDSGLYGFQDMPEYGELAYEDTVMLETRGPISPLAYEPNMSFNHPWAKCVVFSDEMLLELMKALIATGG